MRINEERLGNMLFVTLSDIGTVHKSNGYPNQDAVDFHCTGDSFVLAVADGVGSCKKADQGAKNVIDSSIKLFHEVRKGSVVFEASVLAEKFLEFWLGFITNGRIDDYCTTAKVVIKIGDQIKALSIGDGFVAISSGDTQVLSPLEESYFANETMCLSSRLTVSHFWTADLDLEPSKSYVVFCCTDGVADCILPGREMQLVQAIEKDITVGDLRKVLEAFIADISNYCQDDKTLGVVKYEA